MKRFLKSKKMLAATALALVLAAGGASYAWFTTAPVAMAGDVNLGTLEIAATFDGFDNGIYFEPDLAVESAGTITNTGNLGVMVKAEFDGIVTFKNGGQLPLSDPAVKAVVQGGFDESKIGYSESKNLMWFYVEPTTPGGETQYYVMLFENGDVADMGINIYFDESMGNEYQGAKLTLDSGLKGTQVNNKAFKAIFGINDPLTELIPVDNNLDQTSGRSASSGSFERMLEKYHNLLNR